MSITLKEGDWVGLRQQLMRFANVSLGPDSTPHFADLSLSAPSSIYSLSHDSFTDFVADEHVAHSGVTITGTDGCGGGGDISASRTITNTDKGSTAVAAHESSYDHTDLHDALTLGTANGLTLSTQELSFPTTAEPTLGGLSLLKTANASASFKWTDTSGYGAIQFTEDTTDVGFLRAYGSAYGIAALRDAVVLGADVNNTGSILLQTNTGGLYTTRMAIANDGTVTIGSLSGVLKATAGAISGSANHSDLGGIGASDHHDPVTLGTANGLSLTDQELSLPTSATPTLGKLTISSSSAESILNMSSTATSGVVQADINGNTWAALYVAAYNSNTNRNGVVGLRHARGTIASPTNVADEDILGQFYAQGYYESAFRTAAGLQWNVDGTPISEWYLPGRLTLHTSSTAAAFVERMRIDSSGNVGIGKASSGEKLEVNGKIRADTAFNVNGTDGVSGTYNIADISSITISGGIITSVVT